MALASSRTSAPIPPSTRSAADRQHTVPEAQQLRAAVEAMDCLAQEGLLEIASMARLVLARLEDADAYEHLDDIANAIQNIWGKASTTLDYVSYEAEQVGCGYTDPAAARRRQAYQTFTKRARHV